MIRFINLGVQIDGQENEFAFFNTDTVKFEEFNGCQTWYSAEDFISDYTGDNLERYLSLIPKQWEKK